MLARSVTFFFSHLLISGFLTSALFGQAWLRLPGPPGGAALSFTLLPDNTLLAGSTSGVFISFDGGTSWLPRSEGTINEPVRALLARESGTVYAVTTTGIYRSPDQGLTWLQLDLGVDTPAITSLVEGAPGELYAGSETQGVFVSVDGGDSWTTQNNGLTELGVNTVAYSKTGDLYAGTNEGLFRLPDQMTLWERANDGLSQMNDRIIHTIVSYPSGRQYAGTASGVFESDADSITWRSLARNLGGNDAGVRSIQRNALGELYVGTRLGVFRSLDDGLSWNAVSDQLPAAFSSLNAVQTLMLNGNETLLVGTTYFGVYAFIRGQEIWTPANAGFASPIVRSLALNRFGDVLAGTSTGLYKSMDRGMTWDAVSVHEPFTGVRLLDQDTDGALFAAAGALYRSEDGGDTWRVIWQEMPDVVLAADTDTYLAALPSGELWKTEDAGETWQQAGVLPAAQNSFTVLDMALSPQGILMAGTTAGLFVSADLGDSWMAVSTGASSPHWYTLGNDTNGRFYAGGPDGLYRSDRDGANWALVFATDSGVFRVLVQSPEHIIAVTSENGIFRSTDSGVSWQPQRQGLPEGSRITAAILDETSVVDAAAAYVALAQGGLYRNEQVLFLSGEDPQPSSDALHRVALFPNPARSEVTLRWDVPIPSRITVEVVDLLGRPVAVVVDRVEGVGVHETVWQTSGVAPGVYLVRITSGASTATRVLVLQK